LHEAYQLKKRELNLDKTPSLKEPSLAITTRLEMEGSPIETFCLIQGEGGGMKGSLMTCKKKP
jgi:hypothetical protein